MSESHSETKEQYIAELENCESINGLHEILNRARFDKAIVLKVEYLDIERAFHKRLNSII